LHYVPIAVPIVTRKLIPCPARRLKRQFGKFNLLHETIQIFGWDTTVSTGRNAVLVGREIANPGSIKFVVNADRRDK
jgi:hypothetical protein